MLALADNFQAGAALSLVMPVTLLIGIVIWYLRAVTRIPQDTPESSTTLPPPEMVRAAGDAVDELTPIDPPTPEA